MPACLPVFVLDELIGPVTYKQVDDVWALARDGVVQGCVAFIVLMVDVETFANQKFGCGEVFHHGWNYNKVVALGVCYVSVNLETVQHLAYSSAVSIQHVEE